jgi:CBS domain-containing protein
MKIQDVMTRDVSACSTDDMLSKAAQLMWERDCGSVPVIDSSGSVCGMVTDRDICMAAYTQGLPLHEIAVRRAMSSHVHACRPEATIEEAQTLMRRNKVRRAPVLDRDHLVGIVSLSDLVARAAHAPKQPGLRPEILMQTLEIISAPNDVQGAEDASDSVSTTYGTPA